MDRNEGARIIRDMATCIAHDPSQFSFQVTINSVGFMANNTAGTGFIANPRGGGPGSTTIGMQASGPSNLDIQVMSSQADQEVVEQLNRAVSSMEIIANELERTNPNGSLITDTFELLKKSILPAIVTVVVKNIIDAIIL